MTVIYIDDPTDAERELLRALTDGGVAEYTEKQPSAEVCPTKGSDGTYYATHELHGPRYIEAVL